MNRASPFDDLDVDISAPAASRMSADEVRERTHIVNGGEQALVTCPKCRGSGYWRPGYSCFTCKGKGKATTRQAGAVKAKATRAANHQAWCEEHRELLTTLGGMSDWNSFAASMLEQVGSGRSLSENQIAACHRMFAKVEARREERKAAREAAKPIIATEAIQALFDKATENALKKPVFRTLDITIAKAPMTGSNPGALYVTTTKDKTYCGKIVDGKYSATYGAPDVLEHIQRVAKDPAGEAMAYARKFKSCFSCGRTLRNPVSVISVIGPICAEHWGLEHLREEAAIEVARLKAEELTREAAEEKMQ